MKKHCFLALFVMVAVACAPPASQQSTDIPALSDAWEKALNDGDVDALVAMYTDDARVLPPNEAMGQGGDAVRAAFGAMIDAGLGGELDTVEAVVAGDVGYHVGTYAITAEGSVVDRGKFIEVWRQVGGEWKIANDIWNSDMPAAGAGGTTVAITLEVKDSAVWLAAWQGPESRREIFKQNGATDVRVFQSPDDPKRVGLMVELADMDAFMTWVQSEASTKAKAEDGVIEATLRLMTEVE